ncbi:MAG: thiamine ABC transporter substrate-binding protein [Treponema sp.]|nr:thiamine ABC transporter substrate-binding protein [Treponema sp.]
MNKIINYVCIGILAICSITAASCRKTARAGREQEVVVYVYDSFLGEWGAGPLLAAAFTERTGYTVRFVNCGDAADVLAKAIVEKDNTIADVLIGIDNNMAPRAREEGVLAAYQPAGMAAIPAELVSALGTDGLLTPYDWSTFAFIYDTLSTVPAPTCLEDLTRPEYEQRVILMDPRTSTPGLGFVAWTRAVFGDEYAAYWRQLRPSILTMAPGWSAGYGLFTAGEAPLVISYVTSAAYHAAYDDAERYRALVFDQGHVTQVEGAGITAGAPNRSGAEAFLDYLVSSEGQAVLPLTQWMYPANYNTPMPDCYATLPAVTTTLAIQADDVAAAVPVVMDIVAGAN